MVLMVGSDGVKRIFEIMLSGMAKNVSKNAIVLGTYYNWH